jgi:hypothetical protein
MKSKHRGYSITIHNVDQVKAQKLGKEYAQEGAEYTMSVEPNPEGDGYHLHLFIQYRNQRYFKAVLKELEKLSRRIGVPRPEGETRDWGRVQLDVMRGTMKQAKAYLLGQTKDKPTGEVYQAIAGRPPEYWAQYHSDMWSQFEDWCNMLQDDYEKKYGKVGAYPS